MSLVERLRQEYKSPIKATSPIFNEAADEIESLEAQLTVAMRERNDAIQASMNDMSQLAEANRKLEVAREALKLDAARYRWLYKNCDSDSPSPDCRMMDGSDLEYLIDKALALLETKP